MLRDGFHKSFTELFALMEQWDKLREAAKAQSLFWQQRPLEDQPDKLDNFYHYLTRAEAAERKGRCWDVGLHPREDSKMSPYEFDTLRQITQFNLFHWVALRLNDQLQRHSADVIASLGRQCSTKHFHKFPTGVNLSYHWEHILICLCVVWILASFQGTVT